MKWKHMERWEKIQKKREREYQKRKCWKTRFAFLPLKAGKNWIWLEKYEERMVYENISVHPFQPARYFLLVRSLGSNEGTEYYLYDNLPTEEAYVQNIEERLKEDRIEK